MPTAGGPRPGLSRRGVLAAGVLGSFMVTGCGRTVLGVDVDDVRRDDAPSPLRPVPGPDDDARVAAVVGAIALRDAVLAQRDAAVAAVPPSAVELLTRVAADHDAHLVQLGPPPSPSAPVSPVVAAADVGLLAAPEMAGAAELLALVTTTSGPLARLLASVAACRVVHSLDLAAASTVAGPPPEVAVTPFGAAGTLDDPVGPVLVDATLSAAAGDALLALVAAEHAAAFAYGLVGVWFIDAARAAAVAAIDTHQRAAARLDDLAQGLGLDPPPAEVGYATAPLADTAAAAGLAADVELDLAATAAALVSAAEADLRDLAADVVVARTVAAGTWRRPVTALPALPEHS